MTLLKEPLLHFLVLATLLFALEHMFSSTEREQIIVDEQTAVFLIKQREDLELRQLRPEEQDATIAAYVEDEILYSEAYKRGLDRGDSRMRRNMILKMRGLLVGDLRQPTSDQLRAYYDVNPEEFTRPATITMDHVFYSDSTQVPQNLLAQLLAGADYREFGKYRPGMGRAIQDVSQRMLAGIFGADAAREIAAIEDELWHGPFDSVQGVHFVRITNRTAAVRPDYEQIESFVESQWAMTESRKAIEQEIERLQDNYEVVIEAATETPE